jgi:hypothetical protein
MANVSAAGTRWNLPNVDGMLFNKSKVTTPLLSSINNVRVASGNEFAMGAGWELESVSQPDIDETDSLTAPTPVSYVRANEVNTTQIFQKKISVSYQKLANGGRLRYPEVSTSGYAYNSTDPNTNSAPDEWMFQVEANLQQVRAEMEYTFLNGTYQQSTAANVSYLTRGILTGSTTNTVAASAAALDKTLFDSLLKEMADNNADFDAGRFVIMVNSFQKQAVSDLFSYEPPSRTEGGRNIQTIFTDFAEMDVVYNHRVPAGTLAIIDTSKLAVVFTPVPGKSANDSFMILEPLSKSGAGEVWQMFGMVGIEYGSSIYHGTLTGLATS